MIKFNARGQWKLVGEPYDAVDNPEKYANKDASYKGISSQTDYEKDIEKDKTTVKDSEVLSNHADRKTSPDIDVSVGHESIDGIEKNPPNVDTPGILFDENGRRKNA